MPQAIASASTLVRATKSTRLVGIGQQLVVGERALGAVAVLGLAPAPVSSEPRHAELALDRGADRMGHLGDARR